MEIRKPRITKKDLVKLQKAMQNMKEMDKWMKFLRETEPHFFKWVEKKTGEIISRVVENIRNLSTQNAHILAQVFLWTFLIGWIVKQQKEDEETREIVRTPEEEFALWQQGKLPARFYDYSTEGLKKEDTRYLAKMAHLQYQKSLKEKRQKTIKQLELFQKVKMEAESKITEEKLKN